MWKQLAPLAAVLVLAGGIPAHAADSADAADAADAADTADAIQLKAQPPAPPSAPAAPADPLAAVKRLGIGDARKALADGKAVLVDVNPSGSYNMEHAKGALGIPANEMYARTGELPKDRQIIVYCSCSAEQTSARVAAELQRQGFEAAALLGGLQAWKDAGYEVERTPAP